MLRSYKYRIYPNKKQKAGIDKTLYLCRTLYNLALEQRIFAYKTQRKNMRKFDQCNELVELKKEYPIYSEVHSQVLQNTLDRLDKAFQNFFRRIKNKGKPGFPRFKSEDRFNSFLYPQYKFALYGGKLVLPKIGDMKIIYHREMEGVAKTLSVAKEADKYYVSITCEIQKEAVKKTTIRKAVGVDLGLIHFATLSNGEEIENPRYLKKSLVKLKRQQRRLSRKKKRSVNRKKQRLVVARIHNKIKNQRRDFLHKLSKALVGRFDLIGFEDLNIRELLRKKVRNISRSISDAAWRQFVNYCAYKAEEAGKHVTIEDARGTTKECSGCHAVMKLPIWVREYNCPQCGLVINRDLNAALNIADRAIKKYLRNCGNTRLGSQLKLESTLN